MLYALVENNSIVAVGTKFEMECRCLEADELDEYRQYKSNCHIIPERTVMPYHKVPSVEREKDYVARQYCNATDVIDDSDFPF